MSECDQIRYLLYQIVYNLEEGNTNAAVPQCEETIDHYSFYQGFLIPAVLITLSFSFTQKRKKLFLEILNGRPGTIFPMDIMTRNSSMSYAAAFGSTLYLVAMAIFNQKTAFKLYDKTELNRLLIIPSMIVYGLVYFPVFACLAIRSTYGYIMGSLYIWSFTALSLYTDFQCAHALERDTVVALVFLSIPQNVCLFYLCIGIPRRCYEAFKTKKNIFETISEDCFFETLEDIKASYVGHHVRKLLIKPEPEPKPELPDDFKGKMIMKLKMFWNRWVYKRDNGFRYSSRFKSTVFVGVLLLYILSVVLLYLSRWLYKSIENKNDHKNYDLFKGLSDCFISAVVLAIFINLISILHIMTSYRKNLRDLHKGIHTSIPATHTRSNTKLLVGSMRYAGYQVGYIGWGLVIQVVIFWLLFILIWALINVNGLFVSFLKFVWPIIVPILIINILQILLAKFLFLQGNGTYLAIENRRMLFSFTYFMFFYNIFLGAFSCSLRIVKTMAIGALLLPRLDHSTLPQKFRFFDPGFAAYVGFMHMENSHTHPVVLVLVRNLLARRRSKSAQIGLGRDMVSNIETGTGSLGRSGLSEEEKRRRKSARVNWHVAYTLINNPELRLYRKGYLETLKKVKTGGNRVQATDNIYTDLSMISDSRKPKINNPNFLKSFKNKEYDILEEVVHVTG